MIDIQLKYHLHEKWFTDNQLSVIGTAFIGEKLLHDKALYDFFDGELNEAVFKQKLNQLSGHFAVVINKENEVYFAVDYLRTYPLFYFISNKEVLICDNIVQYKIWNENTSDYFSKLFCTPENETLLKNWKQLQAGAYGIFQTENGNTVFKQDFYYKHQAVHTQAFDKNLLKQLEDKLIYQIKTIAQDKTILLPLSGGYDSRYLLSLLYQHNIKSVVCFTYGKKDSYEVVFARNSAEKLKYPWHFIDYDDNLLSLFLGEEWNSYAELNHHYTSLPHEQDFFALHYLKSKNLLPENAIVMNGFCQDLHGGSIFESGRRFDATSYIQSKYKVVAPASVTTSKNDYQAYQDWFIRNRVSKFIINAVHVYAYFGLSFYLPFWDKTWIQFWYNLPIKERIGQQVYNDYIFSDYFKPLFVDFKKPLFDTTLALHSLKQTAKKILPKKIVEAIQNQNANRDEYDVNNTRFLYEFIYKKLKNTPPQKNYKINEIHALFLLESLKNEL